MIKIIRGLIMIGKPIFRGLSGLANQAKRHWKYFVTGWVLLMVAMIMLWGYSQGLFAIPNINKIYTPPNLSTTITDVNGKLLYKLYDGENRTWIKLNEIPNNLIWATLAIEDKTFFKHHGISTDGLIKAVIYNFKNWGSGKFRGGSTITQQLVKNVFLSRERTWTRKFKEGLLAIIIEFRISKEEILERYFNQVAYGGEIYGIAEAANKYFGKKVGELSIAESAFIAGLPASPSTFSPNSALDLAIRRQHLVLNEMVNAGFISEEQKKEAINEKLKVINNKQNIEAPHFVFYIKDKVEKDFGFDNINTSGLKIKTTLDLDKQKMAEKILTEEMAKISRLRINNGAVLILDTKTGGVLSMVGSKDFWDEKIDGKFNVTTALRQPGSSIKPINYLLALKNGKSLASTVVDEPVSFIIPGQKPYVPHNYTGGYMGRVTLKTALASSLNIPSVKILAENGVDNFIDMAEKMGITTWTPRNRFGLSLALGAGEVKMTELAGAYSIFANMGNKVTINPINQIDNYLGEKVYQKQIESKAIVEPEYAFLINQALSDNKARTPIFGPNSKLLINGKTVAVKTGTTNSLKDNWCIGWTPKYLVAVWVGNNDGKPMSYVASGVTGATPIWNRIMTNLLANEKDEPWPKPEKIVKTKTCRGEEYLVKGTEKTVTCPTPTQSLMPNQ
ncbi:MAG TPA: PBP1A family penicillin-binding protein [Candidatus Woesebacteria bacterium]|nr:PBP1A family penicillin-binding protein [Candidatus Woesebacteria bacterium]